MLVGCIVVKIGGSQVANRPAYVAIGANMNSERDVLDKWVQTTEGANSTVSPPAGAAPAPSPCRPGKAPACPPGIASTSAATGG
jgi:hypothetical protein